MPAPAAALLSPDDVAFIGRGVSTLVASRDARLRPSVMRAMGSTVTADGRCVTVYLSRLQARQLLSDLASCARIAVTFSQPASHRTLQLKARFGHTESWEKMPGLAWKITVAATRHSSKEEI